MAPTDVYVSAEKLMDLAASVFTEHAETAPTYTGPEAPHDGYWVPPYEGEVEIVLVRRGDSIVEIHHYPSHSHLEFAIWEFSANTNSLIMELLRDGTIRANTHWSKKREVPLSKLPPGSIDRVYGLISPSSDR